MNLGRKVGIALAAALLVLTLPTAAQTPPGPIQFPRILRVVPAPAYPEESRHAGEQGTVEVSVDLEADGSVRRVRLMESSGYARLDHAVVDWLKVAQFAPATAGDKAIGFRDFRVDYEWRLDGPPRIATGQAATTR